MRDFRRINTMLARVRQLWHHYPDMRLMQLLQVVIGHGGDHFYLEDDVLERRLKARVRDWGAQIPLPPEEEVIPNG